MAGFPHRFRPSGSWVRPVGLGAAAAGLLLPWIVELDGLSSPGQRMLGVFLAAVVLWVTEAIPLHATAVLVILAEITLISDQALWELPPGFAAPEYREFFATLAHPVLMLFLGGFFLAEGAAKFRLDRTLARVLLRPFGTSSRSIVLGLMIVTAVFSMFMSNTATTATLLAVVLPVAASLDPSDPLRTSLVLAIPVAANIGGIGTPVGTPPNAIAVGLLTDAGIDVGFGRWMVLAVPLMIVVLLGAWWLLLRLYPPSRRAIRLVIEGELDRSPQGRILIVTFAVTVALWLTEPIHGVPTAIVGFVPVVVLLATGVFSARDLQALPWHVLWLVAGGIALGIGVTASGLDVWLIGRIDWTGLAGGVVVALVALTALAVSTVISNSAAANLLIPIGLTLALSGAVDAEAVAVAFFIAVGASLAMALPVSTPPNAIAYSTGMVTTRQMAVVGIGVGVGGWVLYVGVAPVVWRLMGVSLS
jgi:sodium-dependent dicarboxylate transporter 2/3/5